MWLLSDLNERKTSMTSTEQEEVYNSVYNMCVVCCVWIEIENMWIIEYMIWCMDNIYIDANEAYRIMRYGLQIALWIGSLA